MKHQGFTLVELLAVIIILAIILAIAIPGITGIVNNAKINAFEDDLKMVVRFIENEKSADSSFNPTDINETNIGNKLGISNANYATLTVTFEDNKPYITIIGQNKWGGLKACGTSQAVTVVAADDQHSCTVVANQDYSGPGYITSKDVNGPVLATGMTPIKRSGNTWIDTVVTDSAWYNYTDKNWANARSDDCTTPGNIETCSMWVWVPRYVYKINSGWHAYSTSGGTIDVLFSMGTDDTRDGTISLDAGTTANASNVATNGNKYTNHPAFTFGTTELTGFWVAKFEPSSPTGLSCYTSPSTTSCNNTSVIPYFIPNVFSWRYATYERQFTSGRSLETTARYGWDTSGTGIDTHMMKNVEWGAVAYLAQSTYGKNSEVWINNSSTYITGCAGNSASEASYAGCQNAYDTENGVKASTSGTIYGIYDMSGGAQEFTASYVNNGNSVLTTNSPSLLSADDKYKDIYSVEPTEAGSTTYALAISHKGDAIYETSSGISNPFSWYRDYSAIPYGTTPWFPRGGKFVDGTEAGMFYFKGTFSSTGSVSITWRPVLLVGSGL